MIRFRPVHGVPAPCVVEASVDAHRIRRARVCGWVHVAGEVVGASEPVSIQQAPVAVRLNVPCRVRVIHDVLHHVEHRPVDVVIRHARPVEAVLRWTARSKERADLCIVCADQIEAGLDGSGAVAEDRAIVVYRQVVGLYLAGIENSRGSERS